MKKFIFSLFLGLVFGHIAFAQTVLNSFPAGNPLYVINEEVSNGIATDSQNNVFSAGIRYQFPFTNTDSSASVIQKYTPAGTQIWAGKTLYSPGARGVDVCTDPSGNSYVLGYFYGNSFQLVGAAALPGAGARDLFLAKYSPDGVLQWLRVIGGPNNENAKDIVYDAGGNIFITGSSAGGQILFGNGVSLTIGSLQQGDVRFIAKFSASGNALWASAVAGTISGLAVTASGEALICGKAFNQFSIGPATYPGQVNRFYLAKLDTSGAPIWVKTPSTSGSIGGSISLDAAGNCYVAGIYSSIFTLDGITLYPSLTNFTSFLAKFTASGQLQWAKPAPAITNLSDISFSKIKIDGAGNCLAMGYIPCTSDPFNMSPRDMYVCKLDHEGNFIWGIPARGLFWELPLDIAFDADNNCYLSYEIHDHTGGAYFLPLNVGGYIINAVPGTVPHSSSIIKMHTGSHNRVAGRIFYDLNSNGTKEPGEPFAPAVVAMAQPSAVYANSSATGQYNAYVGTGSYTITLPEISPAYSVVPGSYSGTFATGASSDTTGHFALQPIPGMPDLRIAVTAATPRPGFAFPLLITYRNVGTTTLSGSVNLQYDQLLQFQNSVPGPSGQTGNLLSWNFSNLAPTESATIMVSTQVLSTAPLGIGLTNIAQALPIVGDIAPQDNSYTHHSIVVGAFDPNDKQVSQNHLTPSEVAAAKPLDYTVRFQNTGTDTAFVVRILDTLDSQLNIPTFEVLHASHNYTWSIKGNGIIEFRFDNILLPDSNTNEPLSHGFIKYRIKPKTNLQLGNVIRNTAGIYFDFNVPIITNTVTTEVALVSGITSANRTQMQLWPNPNKGEFMVQLSGVNDASVKAELRNVLGQVVWQNTLPAVGGNVQETVRTIGLSRGVYYLQVSGGKGNIVQKVVIE